MFTLVTVDDDDESMKLVFTHSYSLGTVTNVLMKICSSKRLSESWNKSVKELSGGRRFVHQSLVPLLTVVRRTRNPCSSADTEHGRGHLLLDKITSHWVLVQLAHFSKIIPQLSIESVPSYFFR